jgi:uncharacterized protein GlcG (DUF336 family)
VGGEYNRAAGASSIVGGSNNRSTHTGAHILGTKTNSISAHAFHANRLFLSAGSMYVNEDPKIAGAVWLSGGGAAALGSYHLMISNP